MGTINEFFWLSMLTKPIELGKQIKRKKLEQVAISTRSLERESLGRCQAGRKTFVLEMRTFE